jgi:hypothetical protein
VLAAGLFFQIVDRFIHRTVPWIIENKHGRFSTMVYRQQGAHTLAAQQWCLEIHGKKFVGSLYLRMMGDADIS